MAINANEVIVAQNGHIYAAPQGTVGPIDTVVPWAAAWVDLGYATEEGVTLSKSVTTTDINAWQSLTPIRRLITTGELNLAFVAMQTNQDVLKLWFGASWVAGKYSIPKDPIQVECGLGVEWIDGAKTFRMVVKKAALTTFSDLSLNKSAAATYGMTFSALPYGTDTELAYILEPPAAAVAATGATAGIPGTWTPAGSTPPANAAGATSSGVVASPATAWTVGQYVQGSTAGVPGQMHWSGAAWVAGPKP
jgi:hypothetical protein